MKPAQIYLHTPTPAFKNTEFKKPMINKQINNKNVFLSNIFAEHSLNVFRTHFATQTLPCVHLPCRQWLVGRGYVCDVICSVCRNTDWLWCHVRAGVDSSSRRQSTSSIISTCFLQRKTACCRAETVNNFFLWGVCVPGRGTWSLRCEAKAGILRYS